MKSELKILTVIVLHHCRLSASKAFRTLSAHPELDFFIHCNSKDSTIDSTCSAKVFKEYRDETNPGVSAAYNRAFRWAELEKLGYDYFLLADQDTDFSPGYLNEFYSARNRYPNSDMFFPKTMSGSKMISPAVFKLSRAWYAPETPNFGDIDIKMLRPINTGLIVSRSLFERTGGYNERVFLDYSDFEFVERCIKIGAKAVFFDSVNQSELSDHQNVDLGQRLKRYILFLQSTAPLIFRSTFLFLPIWWILRFVKVVAGSIRAN